MARAAWTKMQTSAPLPFRPRPLLCLVVFSAPCLPPDDRSSASDDHDGFLGNGRGRGGDRIVHNMPPSATCGRWTRQGRRAKPHRRPICRAIRRVVFQSNRINTRLIRKAQQPGSTNKLSGSVRSAARPYSSIVRRCPTTCQGLTPLSSGMISTSWSTNMLANRITCVERVC